jgi:hypothetical protein
MFHKGCCAQSKTEDHDDKEQTSSCCFNLYYCAQPKKHDQAQNKPVANWRRLSCDVSQSSHHRRVPAWLGCLFISLVLFQYSGSLAAERDVEKYCLRSEAGTVVVLTVNPHGQTAPPNGWYVGIVGSIASGTTPRWAADSFNSLAVMLAAGVGLHRQRGY